MEGSRTVLLPPLSVILGATVTDPGWGKILHCIWDLGDHTPTQETTLDDKSQTGLTYTYRQKGFYRVTPTVTNDDGATTVATLPIVVAGDDHAPVAKLTVNGQTVPSTGTEARVGVTLIFNVATQPTRTRAMA